MHRWLTWTTSIELRESYTEVKTSDFSCTMFDNRVDQSMNNNTERSGYDRIVKVPSQDGQKQYLPIGRLASCMTPDEYERRIMAQIRM